MIDATALGKAKVVLPGVKNAGLSRVFGAGNWQKLFEDATPSILPAAAAAVAGGDPLVGSRLKATIPLVVSGDVELVEGEWDILSLDGASKYKLVALIGGVRVEHMVSKKVVDAAVAVARRPPPPIPGGGGVVDFSVDVSDYTLSAALLITYIYKSKDGAVASMNENPWGLVS